MRVPSGRWTWAIRTDNCATDFFKNFAEKSFMFKSRVRTVRNCRPDGRTSAGSNFHVRLSRVRTKGDERPDGWTSTRNFHICYARVRTMTNRRPDGDIWITILALCMSTSVQESTSSGRLKQSSLKLNLERIWSWSIDHWEASGRAAETSRRMEVGKVASRNNEGLDGMARRPDEWCLVCRASGRYGTSSGRME
jgi:hypothetical protein